MINTGGYSARKKVGTAIKSKKLIRGECEVCKKPNAHANHDDYNRPLDVRWFCHTHHMNHHKFLADKRLDKDPQTVKEMQSTLSGFGIGEKMVWNRKYMSNRNLFNKTVALIPGRLFGIRLYKRNSYLIERIK